MSDAAKLVRAYVALWNETADPEAIAARFWHEEIEWVEPPGSPNAGAIRGRNAVAGYLRDWTENMGGSQLTIEELLVAGDEVLVALRLSVQGTRSEVELDAPVYYVARVRGTRIDRIRVHYGRREALAAIAPEPDASELDTE